MVTSYYNTVKKIIPQEQLPTGNIAILHTNGWMTKQIYERIVGSDEEQKATGAPKKMGDAVVGIFKWYITSEHKPKSVPQTQTLW